MPGLVHLSEQTEQELLWHFLRESRGFVECKGLGQVKTFFFFVHVEGQAGGQSSPAISS
jgi:hypothetical protein